MWSAAFFELWESEVGPGWLGEGGETTCPPWHFHGVQWPLPALPAVFAAPGIFLKNVFICMAVLRSGRVHPSSEPPNAATPRETTSPTYMASPQAIQQMWLSEASAVYLLSALAWTLHGSQRNRGFLLTCWVKLGHRSSWASCFLRTDLRQQRCPLWVSWGRKRAWVKWLFWDWSVSPT